jgi:hypothetical protein
VLLAVGAVYSLVLAIEPLAPDRVYDLRNLRINARRKASGYIPTAP